ncbi:hypothetical protein KP509_27G047100 [Ceratopteris richardii]|nr:hypothetical protein KP509_27G047100 [Ceratopteris richardii]
MTSQSLLQGLHEYEPLSQEYTNCKYANLPHANMDNDHLTTDLLELNEDDCHESVEASRKSFYSRKSVKSLQTQNSDASFEDLTSVQLDGQISSPESQKPFNNHERIIKVGIENTNSPTISDAHLPRSDLLPLHCQEDSEQNCNGNCLTDILNNSETLQSSFEMPHVRVTEDVSIFHAPNVELLEPVNSSRQTAAQDMFTGLNFSDPPKTWEQEISLMEGFYQQVVGQPTFSSSNSTHVQDVHSFPMIKRPKVPELSFKKTNINKATISAGFCSVENDVANDILVENIDSLKFTSNALFDKEKKEAELKKSVMNDRPLIIMDDNYSEQVHLGEVESAFDFISEIPEEDTEEAKGGTEYVDSVEELMAEKRMLAVLEAELENERNAAAIATSEAMAMISRLQEEKSMLQLEVAQLQRMAEEKAEYDEQEISLLKDMLFKRETENHALEKELQLYRERLLAEKNPHTWNIYDKPDTRIFVEEQCADQKWEMDYGCQFTKSKERGNHQNIFVKDQVASFIEEGTSVTSSMTQCRERHHSHQGLKEIDRSLFSVNNEELQLILSRIWAIEEELREFQRTSSKKARISLNNDQNLNDNLISQKSADHVFETEVERLPDENDNGNGVCLPVHDVYEVHCTPHQQQGPHIRGDMTTEFLEIPEDSRSFSRSPLYQDTKCALHCQILQADTAAVESLPSSEIQSDGAMNNPQDQPNQYEATEGSALFKDTVQQLAARLQVLEADKQIIREVLESVGNRATELKLLQDISQQLRALWVCGAGSTSSGLRALTSPTSVQVLACVTIGSFTRFATNKIIVILCDYSRAVLML